MEAESDNVLDDFGEFATTIMEFQKLIPAVDYSLGIEFNPIFLIQVKSQFLYNKL